MKKKQSEEDLRTMTGRYKWYTHKRRDRGYFSCPKCGKRLVNCPHCHQEIILLGAKGGPDFLIATLYDYVECKQGEEDWSLWDVSDEQTSTLNSAPVGAGWLFLTIGDGKAPIGREGYLIPWLSFCTIRATLESKGCRSVRFRNTERSRNPTAGEVFGPFGLNWVPGSGWSIPANHAWKAIHNERHLAAIGSDCDAGRAGNPQQLSLL